jgi:enolase
MIKLDSTHNKEKLGANATVATSMAIAKAAAASMHMELYEYIAELSGNKPTLPTPMFNIINGGKHAGSELSVQEFMIVPQLKQFSDNLQASAEIYITLKEILLRKYGKGAINVGDEGGFAPPINKTEDALSIISKAIIESGYGGDVKISLDCAAESFYSKGQYKIDGKQRKPADLVDHYIELAKKFKLLSIEDPFIETQAAHFAKLKKANVCKVIGDDLTVTNVRILGEVAAAIDGIIIKPNQVGTITETLNTVNLAKKKTPFIICSHRSGETEDTFIADFAVGIASPYVKFGAPARSERTAKYNRLLRIEELL